MKLLVPFQRLRHQQGLYATLNHSILKAFWKCHDTKLLNIFSDLFLIPFSFVFSSHLFSHFWKVWKEQQEKRCVGTKGSSVFWALIQVEGQPKVEVQKGMSNLRIPINPVSGQHKGGLWMTAAVHLQIVTLTFRQQPWLGRNAHHMSTLDVDIL